MKHTVRLTGVHSASQLRKQIMQKYPAAKVEPLDGGVVYVELPQSTWRMTPGGEEGFFTLLYLHGVISSYQHLDASPQQGRQ